MEFPKYILMPESNVLRAYVLYDTISESNGIIRADYRRPSAFTAYCHTLCITNHGDHFTHDFIIDGKEQHIRWDKLVTTTVWRFLRTNASFVNFPANRAAIDKALEDANKSILSRLFNVRLVADGEIHGLPSMKIEPFASINCKLVKFENKMMRYI